MLTRIQSLGGRERRAKWQRVPSNTVTNDVTECNAARSRGCMIDDDTGSELVIRRLRENSTSVPSLQPLYSCPVKDRGGGKMLKKATVIEVIDEEKINVCKR